MTEVLDILVKFNPWWDEKGFDAGITREKYFSKVKKFLTTGEIVILSGVRRSGKTTLLYQTIYDLINNQNVDPKKILFVNFDEPELITFDNPIKTILDTYEQDVCSDDKTYLIFDEIQNVDGWERWIKSIYDRKNNHLIISGSSSHLLDSKLSTLISGRYLKIPVYPLDFSEYLMFNGIKVENNSLALATNKNKIMNLLKGYLYEGGFPRVVLEKDDSLKAEYLKSYYDSILYRDIVLTYDIRNIKSLRELTYYLCSNFTSLYSYRKLGDLLNMDPSTLKEYMYYAEQAKILFEIQYFSYSVKTQSMNNKKIYCIDNGLRNSISFKFSEDEGRLTENLVFLELKRRGHEPYYWNKKGEVDFVIKNIDNSLTAINVSFTNELDERKTRALMEFSDEFKPKVNELILLTKNTEKIEDGIVFIPLWKWLLVN
ncbi:MAG: ATP-binding protein [Methanosarcinaceae archaeon]|nr:ATP-binding protein [Methanosarcinaceae archaeon]